MAPPAPVGMRDRIRPPGALATRRGRPPVHRTTSCVVMGRVGICGIQGNADGFIGFCDKASYLPRPFPAPKQVDSYH